MYVAIVCTRFLSAMQEGYIVTQNYSFTLLFLSLDTIIQVATSSEREEMLVKQTLNITSVDSLRYNFK